MNNRLRITSLIILIAAIFALAVSGINAHADDGQNAAKENDLIEKLRSAPDAEKAIACKELAVYGSAKAVPELAPLLADERLASWSRIALEVIPGPEAGEALRKAMDSLQGKLLRVLETEKVLRLGGTTELATEFRLVVSVQRPASELVAGGRWRSDFYYRVAGLRLKVPALGERRSDIPLLAKQFVRELGATIASDHDLDALQAHHWPCHVRELRRAILQSKLTRFAPLEVPADVIEFLARTINRNVRELVGGLNKLIAYAQLTGQDVSLSLAEEQLTDIL